MENVDQLVRMANQIADNFSFHDDAADRLADHLQRFWAPSMRIRLTEYHVAGGDGLKPAVRQALGRLEQG